MMGGSGLGWEGDWQMRGWEWNVREEGRAKGSLGVLLAAFERPDCRKREFAEHCGKE